jgi:hypothetical protein
MAQAFTFRAFGAETQSFHTVSKATVLMKSLRVTEALARLKPVRRLAELGCAV